MSGKLKAFCCFVKAGSTRGMSGKQLIFCIFAMVKLTASRGTSGKLKLFSCFVKAELTYIY